MQHIDGLAVMGMIALIAAAFTLTGIFLPRWRFPLRHRNNRRVGTLGRIGCVVLLAGWGVMLTTITILQDTVIPPLVVLLATVLYMVLSGVDVNRGPDKR